MGTQIKMAESAEQVVRQILEPGEKVEWTGRPHLETLQLPAKRYKKRRLLTRLLAIPIYLVAIYFGLKFLLSRLGFENLQQVDELKQFLEDEGLMERLVPAAIGLGVVILIIIVLLVGSKHFKLGRADMHAKWARSLTYAITNRRLLILEGENIAFQFQPENLSEVRIRERTPGYADVIVRELDEDRQVLGKKRVGRELRPTHRSNHSYIGFKALPNAEAIKSRIENWVEAHTASAAKEVEDFVRDTRPTRRRDQPRGSVEVVNQQFGLRLHVPEEWEIKVRSRPRPYGRVFLDNENWQPIEAEYDWNVVRVEGPAHASIEVHLDEVPEPVTTYEQTTGSKLAKFLGVKYLESDPALEWDRFTGYSVTHRKMVSELGVSGASGDHERPALSKSATLHDGRLQLGVITTWPEGSDDLRQAVEKIASTMQVE